MIEQLDSIKESLVDLPEKDAAGIYIPRNVDENLKRKAMRELLRKLETGDGQEHRL